MNLSAARRHRIWEIEKFGKSIQFVGAAVVVLTCDSLASVSVEVGIWVQAMDRRLEHCT